MSGGLFLFFFSNSTGSCGYPGSLVRQDSTFGWPCNVTYSAEHLVIVRVAHFVTCFLTEITHLLQVLESRPDVESRRTKLLEYPQELVELEKKNKKKSTRHPHLAISLLNREENKSTIFLKPRYSVLGRPAGYMAGICPDENFFRNFWKFFLNLREVLNSLYFGLLESEVCEALWRLFCAALWEFFGESWELIFRK